MKHKKLITCKRRTSDAIEHKTIKKLRKSRRSQIVSSKFSLFPSGIFPALNDNEELKKLKKFKMKIYMIVMSIEGYLKKLTKRSMHFGLGRDNSVDQLTERLKNHSTGGNFNQGIVKEMIEKIVKLRVLALKEVEDVKEKKTFDQRIDLAKERLKEVHGLLKQWHEKRGKFLEKQNQLVINKDPLVLDFRSVNHQLKDDQSRRILTDLKRSWDKRNSPGKKNAGDMLEQALEIFRNAGQVCFQEDQDHSDTKEDEYNRKIQEEEEKEREELEKTPVDWEKEGKKEYNAKQQEELEDEGLDRYGDEPHESDGGSSDEYGDGYENYDGNLDQNQDDVAQGDDDVWSSDDWNAKSDGDDAERPEKIEEQENERQKEEQAADERSGRSDDCERSVEDPIPKNPESSRGLKRSKSGKSIRSASLDYNKKLKKKLELKVARYEKKIADLDFKLQLKLEKLNK